MVLALRRAWPDSLLTFGAGFDRLPGVNQTLQERENAVSDTDVLEYDFEVTFDDVPAPVKRAGRKSKWLPLIEAARAAAVKADKDKRRAPDGGSPWIAYPKSREPVVGTQNLTTLRDSWGGTEPKSKNRKEGSEHFQETGEFFEFQITDRKGTGKKGDPQKGVLWVRRGTKS